MTSVSADRFSFVANTSCVHEDDLALVTSIDVALGNRVDDILAGVLSLLLASWQHFYFEVVADKLVIEDWSSKLTS